MAGRATGERIDGPRKRRVIELASIGATTNKIAKAVKMNWHTIKAIEVFESRTINERKQKLADQFATIAMLGAERLKHEVLTLPPGSLIPAVGMACDKVLAITQEPQNQLNNHIHVHLDKVDLIGQFNTALAQLSHNGSEKLVDNTEKHLPTEKQISAKEIEDTPTQSE